MQGNTRESDLGVTNKFKMPTLKYLHLYTDTVGQLNEVW